MDQPSMTRSRVTWAFYNENDSYAAEWLRSLIRRRLIPDGIVHDGSITEIHADDLGEFVQCHFFAGVGGWSLALRLAGWPDDEPVWTGSCPCQPFSVAGKGNGAADERHLWPEFYRLIRERRPAIVFGEQVAQRAGLEWFDGVSTDLEGCGYAIGAAVIPACAVGAPHRRERLWWGAVADADAGRRQVQRQPQLGRIEGASGRFPDRCSDVRQLDDAEGRMADAEGQRPGRRADDPDGRRGQRSSADRGAGGMGDACPPGLSLSERGELRGSGRGQEGRATLQPSGAGFWSDAEWLTGADGKTRRVKPGVRLLAHGVSNRVGRLRGYGNAIVPQVGAKFIATFVEAAGRPRRKNVPQQNAQSLTY